MLRPEFSDEFDGNELDIAKWNSDVEDWGVWSWEPENVWTEDGNLHVRMQYHEHERDDKKLYYTSGIIRSRATPIKYGYFEARIKAAPRFPGVCPAFWAYRIEDDLWTEIDFAELTEHGAGKPHYIDTNTHVFRHPALPAGQELHEQRHYHAPFDPRDDFHIYGCEWDEREIRMYIDGKLVNARVNEYWHQPLDVVISFGLRNVLKETPSGKGFPTVFLVDYVRVWQKAEQ